MLKWFLPLILTFSLGAKENIIVGSKNFSESVILGEMMALLLENKFDWPVTRKLNLGGTSVAFNALKSQDIHLTVDYTGTGYIMILKMDGERDPDRVHAIVKQEYIERYGITWSNPIGFNNTYALVISKNNDNLKAVKKISDLTSLASKLRFGTQHEFMERKDGYNSFIEKYNFKFNPDNIKAMDWGIMFKAMEEDEVDMIMSYSTDGRIKAFDMRILEDDKQFFPPYYAAVLAREDVLKKFPVIQDLFYTMENLISEEEMIDMNDKVDRLKADPQNVARNFLIHKGLIDGKKKKNQSSLGFMAFLKSKKNYLLKITKEHLYLSFLALLIAVLVAIPTGILLTRYQKLGLVVFPIVNTIQTIPSLALLGFLVPILGIGFKPAILALFLYSLLPLVRNTYQGILEVDSNYVEASRGMGLTNLQILKKVELPLALPFIMAGLRTSTVIVIGTATLAALVGAGGLGDPIFRGVATVNSDLILLGAIPSALLAILSDKLLEFLERILVSDGLRISR